MDHRPTVLNPGAKPDRPPVATSQVIVTRIGHATALLDFGACRVLTDPWFSERWGYYHREPYGLTVAELPHLDGVLVSHDHYDHFDLASFRQYRRERKAQRPRAFQRVERLGPALYRRHHSA
jgi:L-ascorbate metabolism protein UlaG (beta-lactamase superfamily)